MGDSLVSRREAVPLIDGNRHSVKRWECAGAGGEGAPDLAETLKNLAINGAAVAVLGFIFSRDLTGSQKDRRVVEREEALARLQVPYPASS